MAQPGKYTGWIDYVCRDRTVNLYARMPPAPYPRIKPYYFDSSQDDPMRSPLCYLAAGRVQCRDE